VDNTESTFGMTPLDMAILMGDVESTAQLLAAGADPDHLLKLFALTDLYDVTVVHPDKKKTRELLDDDDKVCFLSVFLDKFTVKMYASGAHLDPLESWFENPKNLKSYNFRFFIFCAILYRL